MPKLSPIQIILVYEAAISLLSIIVTAADKLFAIAHSRRVPEATLFLLSVLGGSAAMLLTMIIIRHKTRKPRFMIGIPVIIMLQAVICYFFWNITSGI